eukprot:CAMPEP_0185725734 /NCGR_PEP_ID=MMETSP1171-20130828/1915_1 /TAXON_ID=374046 /ORGANISM="Helicotheca tamensis, Strain CCMP826" /LENGTH=432 /DNA_ID=CAMNT_0028393927 /DNA_START=134 /DNA_END=1432 /DNA_ORIENTATION=+
MAPRKNSPYADMKANNKKAFPNFKMGGTKVRFFQGSCAISIVIFSFFNIDHFYNESSVYTGSTSQSHQNVRSSLLVPRTITYGNHTNVLPPEARLGPNGEPGYVHDPSFLVQNPRKFRVSNKGTVCLTPGDGKEMPEGYKALKKIRKHIEENPDSSPRDVKLMCSIYTYSGGIKQTDAILETWGKRCDGIFFASTETNLTTGHTHFPTPSEFDGKYKGIWQKVRSMFAYLYDNFLDSYEYFHFCGDDTFLIIENLKEFLGSAKVQSYEEEAGNLLVAGFWMHWGEIEGHYLGGGSGYTLSRRALKALVEGPLQYSHTDHEDGAEDFFTSLLFREFLNVTAMDTRDSHGAHRYHQLPVEQHAYYPEKYQDEFFSKTVNESLWYMKEEFGFPIVYQDEYISPSSVAFHRLDADILRRYELLLYGSGEEECGAIF